MAYGLTARQLAIQRFVHGFVEAHGHSPSVREIMVGLNINSTRGVHEALLGLEAKCHIRRKRCHARSIELLTEVAIPRAPDGAALFFVAVGEAG